MNSETLIRAARADEAFLLSVFEGFTANQPYDSVSEWVLQVLREAPRLAAHFELPTSQDLVSAYEAVLTSNSLITAPLLRLLTHRLALYFSIVPELLRHEMASEGLVAASSSIQSFRHLLGRYTSSQSKNTYESIASALRTHRIYFYQDEWNHTTLRAVLAAFYRNQSSESSESSKAKAKLLRFVLEQLVQDVKSSGHIPEPRHGWWALEILAKHAEIAWLKKKRASITKVIHHLLDLPEYSPSQDVLQRSVAPELQTRETEELWIGINIVRVLCSKLAGILPPRTIKRLRQSLNEKVTACGELQGRNSFKIRTIRLLFTYELIRLHALQRAHACCSIRTFDLVEHRLGASFWADSVLDQVKGLTKTAKKFCSAPENWLKHTLTSAMLCGLPGQGKSELLDQLRRVFAEIVGPSTELEVRSYSVGNQINSAQDLRLLLDKYLEESKDTKRVFLMQFDEIDKAKTFNIYTPFLSALEEKIKKGGKALTFWIFAQSTFPTLSDFKAYAESLDDKSLRDFLTRIQWGSIELPELRFSPEQRLLTALGYSITKFAEVNGFTGRWGGYFAGAYHLRNARVLTKEVELASHLRDGGIIELPEDRLLSAQWLVNMPENGSSHISIRNERRSE